jgi:zinc transporter ZupT
MRDMINIRSFFRSPHLFYTLLGGAACSLFPFTAMLVFSSFSNSTIELFMAFLGVPLWLALTGLTLFCPSTWHMGNLGNPSNDCLFVMIPMAWIICFLFGAFIGGSLSQYKERVRKPSQGKT